MATKFITTESPEQTHQYMREHGWTATDTDSLWHKTTDEGEKITAKCQRMSSYGFDGNVAISVIA